MNQEDTISRKIIAGMLKWYEKTRPRFLVL